MDKGRMVDEQQRHGHRQEDNEGGEFGMGKGSGVGTEVQVVVWRTQHQLLMTSAALAADICFDHHLGAVDRNDQRSAHIHDVSPYPSPDPSHHYFRYAKLQRHSAHLYARSSPLCFYRGHSLAPGPVHARVGCDDLWNVILNDAHVYARCVHNPCLCLFLCLSHYPSPCPCPALGLALSHGHVSPSSDRHAPGCLNESVDGRQSRSQSERIQRSRQPVYLHGQQHLLAVLFLFLCPFHAHVHNYVYGVDVCQCEANLCGCGSDCDCDCASSTSGNGSENTDGTHDYMHNDRNRDVMMIDEENESEWNVNMSDDDRWRWQEGLQLVQVAEATVHVALEDEDEDKVHADTLHQQKEGDVDIAT